MLAELIRAGHVDGSLPAVEGGTLTEATAGAPPPDGSVTFSADSPYKPSGSLFCLRGTLAPDGSVTKLAGTARTMQSGPARVFDSEEACAEAVRGGAVQPGDVLVVRYEDMIADPKQHFGAVARHLLMAPTEAQLESAIEMTGFERLRQKEADAGFAERPDTTRQFFRAGTAGQWRDTLSDGQVARIVAAHKPLMRRFGYLPEGA